MGGGQRTSQSWQPAGRVSISIQGQTLISYTVPIPLLCLERECVPGGDVRAGPRLCTLQGSLP